MAQAEEQQQPVRNKRGFSASRNAIDRAVWPEGFVYRLHPLLQSSQSAAAAAELADA